MVYINRKGRQSGASKKGDFNQYMICPACGYKISDGTSLCIRCGNTIKFLDPIIREETDNGQGEDYTEIRAEDMYFSHSGGNNGGLFEELFGGFGFGGNGAARFQATILA